MLADEDLKALSFRVHSLKGSGGLYGLLPISHAAAEVETLIQAEASIEEVNSKVRSLIATIRRVEGYAETSRT